MKSNTLQLKGLVVGRDGAALTSPMDVTAQPGELFLVRGPNGSGKSSFLKTVAGLLPPLAGEILLGAEPPEQGQLLFLGHKRGLTPSMSVGDNVAFWAKACGVPELVPAAMHYFDLSDIADAELATLSAGWQQRVALTRLITMPAPVWLLDEPTANLDQAGLALLQSLMQTRLEQGGIVLMSAHGVPVGDGVKTIDISYLHEEDEVEVVC